MSAAGELATAQVADYLGVKVQTVYAYVSRGVLTPVRRDPALGSIFALADVQALLKGGRAGRRTRRPATSDDVRTHITQVGPGRLAYRGHDVRTLAETHTFEEVRDLLTQAELVDGPGTDGPGTARAERAAVLALREALPRHTRTLDLLKHAALLAASSDVGRHDRSAAAFAQAGARAATVMACAVTGHVEATCPEPSGMAEALATYLDPCPVETIQAALVLLADHDLATSTTAVRVAISSVADAYGALLAGLAAAASPMHSAASVHVLPWLRSALSDPQAAIDAALAGRNPPGFGHVVYTEEDPRAQELLERLRPDCPMPEWEALRTIEDELLQRRGRVLTVDVALALMVHLYGLPSDAGAVLFACARTAGWTAHAIEELAEPAMRFRLRGVYSGQRVSG